MEPASKPVRTTPLALAALFLGIVGLCFFPLQIITVVLAVVALQKIKKDPALGGRSLAIISIVLAAMSIVTTGILAAIAIPQFIRYMRRAKTEEVRSELNHIEARLMQNVNRNRLNAGDQTVTFPPSIPLTPSAPSCEPHRWPVDAPSGWAEFDYRPDGFFRYAYELRTSPDGRSTVVHAEGDLDCDGIRSIYESRLTLDASGAVQRDGEIQVVNELE